MCAKMPNQPAAGGPTHQQVAAKDITIALSNSFVGNTWRQRMVKIFQKVTEKAKADGLIKDYVVSNTSQNTATEQIAALKALILKKPSAILINSASPTALNPVITEACNAGIVVITFDSVAGAPCEYNEQADLAQCGALGADGVLDAMGGEGNVIVVRGVIGSAPEKVIYDAQMAEIKKHPVISRWWPSCRVRRQPGHPDHGAGYTAYAASKAGMGSLARTVAADYSARGFGPT